MHGTEEQKNSNVKLDVDFVCASIGEVLKKAHTNKSKLTIKKKHDRLVFACPVCGDSGKDMNLKRGHLFLNNLRFKCYNENCRSTFTRLCKDKDVNIDPSKKLELMDWVEQNVQSSYWNNSSDDELLSNTFDKAIKVDTLQEWFNTGKGPLAGFMPVNFGSKTYVYLRERGIRDDQMGLFFEGIKHNGKWHEPYVVFLNRMGDKVIGMQERNLESGLKRRFRVWTFSELYESITGEEMDLIEQIQYNKVSCVYNMFNVNYEKMVTVFEGYLDSIWFPNSMALVGVNTDADFLFSSDAEFRFFFDNDVSGKKKAKAMLKRGKQVFLWDKFKEHWSSRAEGDKWMNDNWFESEIKDMNDLVRKLKMNYKQLESFFSTSIFDVRWIKGENKKKEYIKNETKMDAIDWNKHIKDLLKKDTR